MSDKENTNLDKTAKMKDKTINEINEIIAKNKNHPFSPESIASVILNAREKRDMRLVHEKSKKLENTYVLLFRFIKTYDQLFAIGLEKGDFKDYEVVKDLLKLCYLIADEIIGE